MAVAPGQPLLSVVPLTELSVSLAELKSGAAVGDSDDDEYVYVSRLAEQIAHAMLEEEDEEYLSAPHHAADPEWMASSGYASRSMKEVELTKAAQAQAADEFAVSHFAATWRDHGPTEWDCFYTPTTLQPEAVRAIPPSSLPPQLAQSHLFRGGWSSHSYGDRKQDASYAFDTWKRPSATRITHPFTTNHSTLERRESIGTGVFLPKVVNTSSHYRRRAGLSSSKSAHAPRSKS